MLRQARMARPARWGCRRVAVLFGLFAGSGLYMQFFFVRMALQSATMECRCHWSGGNSSGAAWRSPRQLAHWRTLLSPMECCWCRPQVVDGRHSQSDPDGAPEGQQPPTSAVRWLLEAAVHAQ